MSDVRDPMMAEVARLMKEALSIRALGEDYRWDIAFAVQQQIVQTPQGPQAAPNPGYITYLSIRSTNMAHPWIQTVGFIPAVSALSETEMGDHVGDMFEALRANRSQFLNESGI